MAYIKGIVTAVAPRVNSPKELLEITNASLVNEVDKRLFVTILAFVIDDDNGNITFARAGHTPLLTRISGRYEYFTPRGIGIGILNKNNSLIKINFADKIEEMSLKLTPGDFCVLFTDGVTEAMNLENEEFGLDRLKKSLEEAEQNNFHLAPEKIIKTITNQIKIFAGETEPHDDTTIVIINFKY